jgi:hypothetical protein
LDPANSADKLTNPPPDGPLYLRVCTEHKSISIHALPASCSSEFATIEDDIAGEVISDRFFADGDGIPIIKSLSIRPSPKRSSLDAWPEVICGRC